MRNDGVVQYRNGFYQLEGVSRRVRGVVVEEWIDGSTHIRNNGDYVKHHKIAPELMGKPQRRKEKKTRRRPKPSGHHPWRRFRIKPCVRTHV